MAEDETLDSIIVDEYSSPLPDWYAYMDEIPSSGILTIFDKEGTNVNIHFDFGASSLCYESIPKEETLAFSTHLDAIIKQGNYSQASSYISQSIAQARAELLEKHQNFSLHFEEVENLRRFYAGIVAESAESLLRMAQLTTDRGYIKQAVRHMNIFDKEKKRLDIDFASDLAPFAYHTLLPLSETDPLIPLFIIRSFIRNGDYDKSIRSMRDTPWEKYAERKALAAGEKHFCYRR